MDLLRQLVGDADQASGSGVVLLMFNDHPWRFEMATMSTHKSFTRDQSGSVLLDQGLTKQVQSEADFDNSDLCSMIMMVFTLLGLCGLAVAFVSGSFPWFFISFGVFLFFASGMPRKLLC